MKKILATLAILLSIFSVPASAQYRFAAECANEQNVMNSLDARLDEFFAGETAEAPGKIIMSGPFGDPLYQAPGWEKREWNQYIRRAKPLGPLGQARVQRYVVSIHFMYNRFSNQIAQKKFKSTVEQGCVGEETVAEAPMDMGATGNNEDPFIHGFNATNDGTTYYFAPLYPNVEATPAIPWSEADAGMRATCNAANDYCRAINQTRNTQ